MMKNKAYTFSEDLFSDLHKDALGYRPSESYWRAFQEWNNDEKQEQWDYLCRMLERFEAERVARQKEDVAAFEALVAKTINTGAGDRATALRWLMEASDAEGNWSYFAYLYNLPWNYLKEVA